MTKVTNHRRAADRRKRASHGSRLAHCESRRTLPRGAEPMSPTPASLAAAPNYATRVRGPRGQLLVHPLGPIGRDVLFVRFERKHLMIVSGHRDGRKRRASRDCRRPRTYWRVRAVNDGGEQRLLGHLPRVAGRDLPQRRTGNRRGMDVLEIAAVECWPAVHTHPGAQQLRHRNGVGVVLAAPGATPP